MNCPHGLAEWPTCGACVASAERAADLVRQLAACEHEETRQAAGPPYAVVCTYCGALRPGDETWEWELSEVVGDAQELDRHLRFVGAPDRVHVVDAGAKIS